MKIIISPDSYKGSLSAFEVSKCIQSGIQQVLPHAHTKLLPLGDGGEGTVDALVNGTNGSFLTEEVQGL
ncbi:Glycerate kinase [Halalkalibacter krulwichiae]|uniref:Glycerate kinase n=1 Tax=Halalkalibacter krulwichiae TaxID=199441 RepID=A0A1Y9THG0_9BACI|nr:Glycerate kinase [Halalkalibacter krulwichiae]